jgi:hypothetical protein
MLHRRNSKVGIVLVLVVVMSFVGYVGLSMLFWISNVASFGETLRKYGFTIVQATDGPFPSFLWLPPQNVITCQNQTQFLYEARSLNATGEFLGNIYQLDIFHFYAVTSDTMLAYEYTPQYPSSLDPLIDAILSNWLIDVLVSQGLALIIIVVWVFLLILQRIKRKAHKTERQKS